jgi:hypothetical protein
MWQWIYMTAVRRWGSQIILTGLIVTIILMVAAKGTASYRLDDDLPIAKIRGFTLMYYRSPEHSSPPVNRLDPYDSFRKDEEGDLMIASTGKNIFSTATSTEYHCYTLRTKKGTPIIVYQASPSRRWRYKANCHGYTFLDGDYWLCNAQVDPILKDNGWVIVPAEDVYPGDVAIYRNSKRVIVHSAKVVGKDSKGHVLVDSKNGYNLDLKAVWAARVIP